MPLLARRMLLFWSLALGGLSVDLWTKHWAFQRLGNPGGAMDRLPIFGEVLVLETSLNEGALFGLGQGFVPVFAAMACVALVAIMVWMVRYQGYQDLLLTCALGAITGGIAGNLYDRLGLPGLTWNYGLERVGEPVKAVRDWIHFQIPGVFDWPVFNIADSLLVCGAGILIWHAIRADLAERRAKKAASQALLS